jgi:molecular chaperone DnaJ
MFIQIAVETPQHLTPAQRELLEKFEGEAVGHQKGSPETHGFFSKVRDFFDKYGRAG